MAIVPKYVGNRKDLEFLIGIARKIMSLINCEDAIGVREIERALRDYSLNKRVTKGVTVGTVTQNLKKLVMWGLVQEITNPEEVAEIDLRRKKAGKLTSNRNPQKRHKLTKNGKNLLTTINVNEDRPISEQLEAARMKMESFQESNLSHKDKDDLLSLVNNVIMRLESGEDAVPGLRAIYDFGAQLKERKIRKWYDVNELRNLLITLPAMKVPDDALVQGLRVLQLVLRSAPSDLEADYYTTTLIDNLKSLIENNIGTPGWEAFLTYSMMRDGNSRVVDEQVDLFLDVLWRCHQPHYEDKITVTEAVFQVAKEWKDVLSKQQKNRIRKSLGHLKARNIEIFKKNIDSGQHVNEDRQIDENRYRVTLARLSSYV